MDTPQDSDARAAQQHGNRLGEIPPPPDPEYLDDLDDIDPQRLAPDLKGFTGLHRIGEGGMGVVFLVRQLDPERHVAIKQLHPSILHTCTELERFKREIEFLADLKHPNFVVIHSVGSNQGLPYFVMEFLEGGSLRDKLDTEERMTAAAAVSLAHQMAKALVFAHRKGIIHRDLKPSNIMFDGLGQIKIADFGLAVSDSTRVLTSDGHPLGTWRYMSPEQMAGKRDQLGKATDVYSLGLILYEMLCGELPFSR